MSFQLSIPAHLVRNCPINSMAANHYVGRYATPCRCTELEQILADQDQTTAHSSIDSLGLRPRYVAALSKFGVSSTVDLAHLDLERLRRVRGLDKVGLTALIYLCAKRGMEVAAITRLPAQEYPRVGLQMVWEGITSGGDH